MTINYEKTFSRPSGRQVLSYSSVDAYDTERGGYDEEMDEIYYNGFLYELGKLYERKFPSGCCKVIGANLDWRHSKGYKFMKVEKDSMTETGRSVLAQLLPQTEGDIEVYNYNRGICIIFYHHDVPLGTRFYCIPWAKSTFERNS